MMSLGGMPLVHAREAACFLTSCPLGSWPGWAKSITAHRVDATVAAVRGFRVREFLKTALGSSSVLAKYVFRAWTGHNVWLLPSSIRAGKEIFGGARFIDWFLNKNPFLTGI
jgi:hypothetical protein